MRPPALLDAQTELVGRVLRFEQPAERVVAEFVRDHRALGARDRRVLADGIFALLRRLPLLRHFAASGAGPLERRLAIVSWRGDEQVLQAALTANERAWLERCRSVDVAALPEALRHNLPEWLAQPLQHALGSEFWSWVEANDAGAPLDLRVNALKSDRAAAIARLADEGVVATPTPHSPLALRVDGKPWLVKSDAVESGLVEVQDEGSQLLAL
ncbi:MAG: SAM-dependent methyltransferase, partial [Rhizobacter sp.]|nr:SAM-dependent methyltransferase [Rhizobacter sp.]